MQQKNTASYGEMFTKFFLSFYFRTVLDLQKKYQDSTESFHKGHLKLLSLTSHINVILFTIKNEYW